MKTDFKLLLATVVTAAESLTADRVAHDEATPTEQEVAEHNRVMCLMGHAISDLRGVEANLRGLIRPEPEPARRNRTKDFSDTESTSV